MRSFVERRWRVRGRWGAALVMGCLAASPAVRGQPAPPGRPAATAPARSPTSAERLAQPPDAVWSERITVTDRAVVFRLDGWYCFGPRLGEVIARIRWRAARLEQGLRLLVPDPRTGQVTYAPVPGLRDPARRFGDDLAQARHALDGAEGGAVVDRFAALHQISPGDAVQPPLDPRPGYRARHRALGCLDAPGLEALLTIEREAAVAFVDAVRQLEESLAPVEESLAPLEEPSR